jgi:hypothetical protein
MFDGHPESRKIFSDFLLLVFRSSIPPYIRATVSV